MSLMFYAPSLVGNAYFIWQVAFSGDSYGYINSMLLSLGIITEPVTWLKNEAYLMPIIIFLSCSGKTWVFRFLRIFRDCRI